MQKKFSEKAQKFFAAGYSASGKKAGNYRENPPPTEDINKQY